MRDITKILSEIARDPANSNAKRADAYLELGHLHQKDPQRSWGYIRVAQLLIQEII